MSQSETEKYELFLTELTALTNKHGVAIDSCGCCNSMSLKVATVPGAYSFTVDGEWFCYINWEPNKESPT